MNNQNIKKIAAIHDLCGYGKCSLGIAIPVLSASGLEVCPIPTGLFSMHTALKNYEFFDTSFFLESYINSWKKENFNIDAIYSGFLCNKKQIFNILQLYANYKNSIKFVDPVMGDNGKLYKTYTVELCNSIKEIAKHADYITPNLTEACILADCTYKDKFRDQDIKTLLFKLQSLGCKNVVITGIIKNDNIENWCIDKDGNIFMESNENIPYQIHGSGDLFCSCLIAAILNNQELPLALEFSQKFVNKCIKYTINQNDFIAKGINFEIFLKDLQF